MAFDPMTMILITFPLAFAFIIVGLYYISRKYPERKTKFDPIVKSVLIIGGLLTLFILAVGLGVMEREWLEKNLKWFIVAFVLLVAFYSYVAFKLRKPIPFPKRKAKALQDARDHYQGEEHRGLAYFPTLLYHNVVEGPNIEKLAREGIRLTDAVDAFLLSLSAATHFYLLIVLNVYTNENVKMVYNPSYRLIDELLGKEAVSVYKDFKEDFTETGEEEEERKE